MMVAAQQSLAADGAIACFSSNLFHLSSDADRAPQLKASVEQNRCAVGSGRLVFSLKGSADDSSL
jgi:hypothetical protein